MSDVIDEFLEVAMPQLAPGMAEGRIVRWFVREGQTVEPGDLLAEVAFETETAEIEATSGGRVACLLYAAGSSGIKVHAPIAKVQAKSRDAAAAALEPRAESPTRVEALPEAPRGTGHPFDLAAQGEVSRISYREALRDALSEALAADPRVLVLGADVAQNRGAQRVTQGLVDAYGDERVVTLRPLDDAAVSIAVGAAMGGLRPVVEVANWGTALEAMTAALDAAVTMPALSGHRVSVPLVIRGPHGWMPGTSGLEATAVAERLVQIKGLRVMAPAPPLAAKLSMNAALRDGGPVAILEAEELYALEGPVPVAPPDCPLASAHVARGGTQLTIVSYGRLVSRVLASADAVSAEGLSVEVIDLVSLSPLDCETVKASLKTTRRLLIVEEGGAFASIGAELIAELAADPGMHLEAPPMRLSGWNAPAPYSAAYEPVMRPVDERIISAIKALLA